MKSNPASILFTIAMLGIFAWYFISTPALEFDKEMLQQKIDSLEKANDSLFATMRISNLKIDSAECRIDSLESVKKKTIVKYINKKNEIEIASVSYLVHEFDSIFTNNDIKR